MMKGALIALRSCPPPLPYEQTLFDRFRGGDPDASRSVRSAANFVGLQVPEGIPLGNLAAGMAAKYAAKLQRATTPDAAVTGAADEGTGRPSKGLTGVANLKAQLYGPRASGAGGTTAGSAAAGGSSEA